MKNIFIQKIEKGKRKLGKEFIFGESSVGLSDYSMQGSDFRDGKVGYRQAKNLPESEKLLRSYEKNTNY